MKNKIAEIFDNKAIEQLNIINKLLIETVDKLEKSAISAAKVNEVMGKSGTSMSDMEEAQRKLNTANAESEKLLKRIADLESKHAQVTDQLTGTIVHHQKEVTKSQEAKERLTKINKDLIKNDLAWESQMAKNEVRLQTTSKRIFELRSQNEFLTKSNKDAKKELEAGVISLDQYKTAMIENTTQIQHNKIELGALNSEQKVLMKEMEAIPSSLSQMSQTLIRLKNDYKSLTDEERESAFGTELKEQIQSTVEGLKLLESEIGENQRDVGNYGSAIEQLDVEMKGLRSTLMLNVEELARMKLRGEDGSEAYKTLAKNTSDLKDRVNDVNSEIKAMASDTKNLDGLIGIAQGLTASFGVYQSTLTMVGIESEDIEKTQAKLMATMAMLNSLQELQNLLQKESAARILITNTLEKIRNAGESKNIVLKTASIMVTKAVTAAQWLYNAALTANPIGLVVVAVGALVTAFIALRKWTNSTAEALYYLINPIGIVIKLLWNYYKETKKNNEAQTEAVKKANERVKAEQMKVRAIEANIEKMKVEIETMVARGATEQQVHLATVEMYKEQIRLSEAKLQQTIAEAKMQAEMGKLSGVDLMRILKSSNAIATSQKELTKVLKDEDDKRAKASAEASRQQADEMKKRLADIEKLTVKERIKLQKKIEGQLIEEMEDGFTKQYALTAYNLKWQTQEMQMAFDERMKGINKNSQQYIDAENLLQAQLTEIRRASTVERMNIDKEYADYLLMTDTDTATYEGFQTSFIELFRNRKMTELEIDKEVRDAQKKMADDQAKEDEERLERQKELGKKAYEELSQLAVTLLQRESVMQDRKIEKSEANRQKELANVNLTEEQKERINKKYDRERKKAEIEKAKIAYKIAVFQKAQSAIDITTQTALAVISALAQVPKFDYGISAGALSAVYAGIGAVQLANVLAQPLAEIPSFAKGVENFEGGWARFGEAGKELLEFPTGEVALANKETVSYLPKGTSIFNNTKTERIMEDMKINNVISFSPITGLLSDNNKLLKKMLTKETKNVIFVNVKSDYRDKYKN